MKKIKNKEELQKTLLEGAKKLTETVSITLGPQGQNVLIHQKNNNPFVTKDGVTVARFIDLEDEFENAGAQLLKQVAIETEKTSGDGTTTATVLAYSILSQAQKYLAAGANPRDLKLGIEKATKKIIEILKEKSKSIRSKQDIEDIATISANGDKTIGSLIATAIDKIGKDGSITIQEARSLETSLDVVEGFRFDGGYISAEFVNNERRGAVSYRDPLLLITDYEIDQLEEILPILKIVARENRPFVIIAEEVRGQTLAALIANVIRGTMKVSAIKAPKYGEERKNLLQDLALSTGATFISRSSGIKLKDVELKHLGLAKSIESNRFFTTIIDGHGNLDKIDEKIDSLKEEIKQSEDIHLCERIQERITRLSSGVAVISVGGSSDVEAVEKKHRIEDALEAVRSAQQEGIIPGGGTAFLKISHNLKSVVDVDNEDQKLGVEIIQKAIQKPFEYILTNAGISVEINKINVSQESDFELGFNVMTGKIENLLKSGVVDPVKVSRCALQNAVSVVSLLLITNSSIIEI